MHAVIEAESKVVAHQLERNGVIFVRGTASFVSPAEVLVSTQKGKVSLCANQFVIATGTSPIQRPEFSPELGPVFDSDTILALKAMPKKLLIVGAGVIGCEYASIFCELGSHVTLIDRRLELLRNVDFEIVKALQEHFTERGIELQLGAEPGTLHKPASAVLELTLGGGKSWSGDAVLVCLGRQANTRGLGLENIGVEMDSRGQIKVDPETYRTSLPNICAVGDVIGPPALAAASAEQGRIAVSRLYDIPTENFPAAFPSGIYTIPEISCYGQLETELREKPVPYVVGRAFFRELARGLITGEKNGFIKLLVHRETRLILGVHVFGMGASELIHIGQLAHALHAPVAFLVQNVFNYPTFAEAYKVAALNALNQLRNQ
jgi:NAD(P) transhydrogenase